METTSYFPGLIALLLAALLGFLAAWIWRSRQLAAAQQQAARLRRERREMTAKMTQASRKFKALDQQRTKAVDALSTLKHQHQALETGHAQLIASYANLKQSAKRNAATALQAESADQQDSEDEWFDGMDDADNGTALSETSQEPDSSQKRQALKELEAFEQQLTSVSEQLVRENKSSAVADPVTDLSKPSSATDAKALQAQIARQEAEIERLREQMAPLLGLPLAVSTREAERDRLADVLQAKEKEIASKDELLTRQEKELASKQQEIAATTRELEKQTQAISANQLAFDAKLKELDARQQQDASTRKDELQAVEQQVQSREKEISELNAALRQRAEREATLNRELEELNAAAKRAEETHREELRRMAATKTASAPDSPDAGDTEGKLGNLGREVKDSSSTDAQPQKPESVRPAPDETTSTASTVQPAPLGSTVAVKDLPVRQAAGRQVNGTRADVAAVELSPPRKKKQSVPRQFDRAPARVDNLKEIKGIGPVLERMLNRLGVYQFSQIAAWSEDDIAYFDEQLSDFRGRIRRDDWPAGAAVAYERKYA